MNKGLGLMLCVACVLVAVSGAQARPGGTSAALSTEQVPQLNKPKQDVVKDQANCSCHKKACQKIKSQSCQKVQ